MNRKCNKCLKVLEYKEFHNDKNKKDGKHPWCKECVKIYHINRYKNNKEKISISQKKSDLKRHYGISLDDYNQMYKKQNGKCFICGNNDKKLCVDHDHKKGSIRKLLCSNCNTSLGLIKEDINILKNMIKYLRN